MMLTLNITVSLGEITNKNNWQRTKKVMEVLCNNKESQDLNYFSTSQPFSTASVPQCSREGLKMFFSLVTAP